MKSVLELKKIAEDRLKDFHIRSFKGMDKPLILISTAYAGVWMEHIYDAVFLASLDKKYLPIAINTIEMFLDKQSDEGQFPCYVRDRAVVPDYSEERVVCYSHIQECVSVGSLFLKVCEMTGDKALLTRCYNAIENWTNWLKKYRMTRGLGLTEMFCGVDTGHDNSGRLADIEYRLTYDDKTDPNNWKKIPASKRVDFKDGVSPIITVDMNCNLYGNFMALSKMAKMLGLLDRAKDWENEAKTIKKRLFELCFDKEDCFFYDLDINGNKRKFLSSTIFHLFQEKVLDKIEDKDLIEKIYTKYIKNPKHFWTEYPFPSMSASDPSSKDHIDGNTWGYFTQGLTVLRATLWMDEYGYSEDFNYILSKWLKGWTDNYETLKFGQELDPHTGKPSTASEWYSTCLLLYIYGTNRLGLI